MRVFLLPPACRHAARVLRARARRRSPGLLAVALIAPSCGVEPGIEEASPLLVMGEMESPGPDEALWAPIDIAGGDGVWVLDAGARRVYGYDLRGRHQITIGKPGKGPGELDGPFAIGLAGDSLWVLDAGNRRIEFFTQRGDLLGSRPLPDTLPPPVDFVRWGGAFYGALPFVERPLVRLGAAPGDVSLFGAELFQRAAELAPAGGQPSIYRLGLIGDELWAAHLYLPLVGVYDRSGRLLRLLEYPAPPIEAGRTVVEATDGKERRTQQAPEHPVGGVGFLSLGDRHWLLTHQEHDAGRQVLVSWPDEDGPARRALGPPETFLVSATSVGGRTYAVGTRGELEVPVALIVDGAPRTQATDHDTAR